MGCSSSRPGRRGPVCVAPQRPPPIKLFSESMHMRRKLAHFNDSIDHCSIDNLPWDGEDAIV